MGALLGTLALAAAPLRAQDGGLVLEGGAARALPPAGVAAETATYGVGGLRFEWAGPSGSLLAGAYGGRAAAGDGSDFVSGVLGGEIWLGRGAPIGIGLGALAQGFAVQEPLLYRVSAVELSPMVRFGRVGTPVVIRGRFGTGSSRVELHRADGAVRRAEKDLWVRGVDAELRMVGTDMTVTAVAGFHRSRAGDFRRGGLRMAAQVGVVTLRADADLWDAPAGNETVGSLSLSVPMGRVEARATVARTAPDPLTLVEPGTQTGVLIAMRLASFGGGRERTVVHEIVAPGRPARVRIRVAPPTARTVEVMGDFGDWTPVPLAREGTGWVVELEIEPGTYHFGFLVDGEWWVPDGLQGAVPDEWGRTNATLVVPEEGGTP